MAPVIFIYVFPQKETVLRHFILYNNFYSKNSVWFLCISRDEIYPKIAYTLRDSVHINRSSKVRGQDASHKRYCSVYVQLTRLRSLEGLHLLQPLSLDDLGNQLHPKLQDEDHRLQRLADMTMRLETEDSFNNRSEA